MIFDLVTALLATGAGTSAFASLVAFTQVIYNILLPFATGNMTIVFTIIAFTQAILHLPQVVIWKRDLKRYKNNLGQ